MEYTRLPDEGILLSQVKYAEALKPLVCKDSGAVPSQCSPGHSSVLATAAADEMLGDLYELFDLI